MDSVNSYLSIFYGQGNDLLQPKRRREEHEEYLFNNNDFMALLNFENTEGAIGFIAQAEIPLCVALEGLLYILRQQPLGNLKSTKVRTTCENTALKLIEESAQSLADDQKIILLQQASQVNDRISTSLIETMVIPVESDPWKFWKTSFDFKTLYHTCFQNNLVEALHALRKQDSFRSVTFDTQPGKLHEDFPLQSLPGRTSKSEWDLTDLRPDFQGIPSGLIVKKILLAISLDTQHDLDQFISSYQASDIKGKKEQIEHLAWAGRFSMDKLDPTPSHTTKLTKLKYMVSHQATGLFAGTVGLVPELREDGHLYKELVDEITMSNTLTPQAKASFINSLNSVAPKSFDAHMSSKDKRKGRLLYRKLEHP